MHLINYYLLRLNLHFENLRPKVLEAIIIRTSNVVVNTFLLTATLNEKLNDSFTWKEEVFTVKVLDNNVPSKNHKMVVNL